MKKKLILGLGFSGFLLAGVVMADVEVSKGIEDEIAAKPINKELSPYSYNTFLENWNKLSDEERENAWNNMSDENKKNIARHLKCSKLANIIENKFIRGEFDKEGYAKFCVSYKMLKNIEQDKISNNLQVSNIDGNSNKENREARKNDE